MRRTQAFMTSIWREACRHTQIHETAASIAKLLERTRGFAQLIVRSVSHSPESLVTVAAAPIASPQSIAEEKQSLSREQILQLQRWARQERILRRSKRSTGIASTLLPSGIAEDVLMVPLAHNDSFLGVLIYRATTDYELDESDEEIVELLREPFSVALANDKRIHEMAALREAAEEDRGALLRRLGRTSLDDEIVGQTSGLQTVMERISMVAHSDVPVLILGETGTGKELAARAIHQRGNRSSGPFIRVNCGAIPRELVDSQLFGHDRGSFTGADQSRQGWFEKADQGTLFLDEIGELPLDAQVRFLRVLQDGFVERVGGSQPIHVDVRIVAATHRDLAGMVREGSFREDLWYRLAVFPILLPPLRDRTQDIGQLAVHFAKRAATRFGVTEVVPNENDIEILARYEWPGNVRELGAVIDRAVILGKGERLEVAAALGFGKPNNLPKTVSAAHAKPTSPPSSHSFPSLDEIIREHIISALTRSQGQVEGKRGAAKLLDINPHTLRAKMRKLSVDWTQFRPSDEL